MPSNRAVAQRWADINFKRADLRPLRSTHMFSDENMIFSYGRHFIIARANAAPGLTLLTSRSYSVTTARHISHVASAIEGAYVRVPDVFAEDHVLNVGAYVTEIQTCEDRILRARKYADMHFRDAKQLRADLATYCAAFGLIAPVVRTPDAVTLKLIKLRLVGV